MSDTKKKAGTIKIHRITNLHTSTTNHIEDAIVGIVDFHK